MSGSSPECDNVGLLSCHPTDVAPWLLGAVLESWIGGERVAIRVTEVEAYGGIGEDPGSHAFRRQTPRNATMFGRAGRAYVYFTYGMHWCLNVVTGPDGEASAVLLRAGEVVAGTDVARRRRGELVSDRDLARGPARLASALGVTGDQDGIDLLDPRSALRLTLGSAGRSAKSSSHVSGPRTGVSGAGADIPWRFHLPGEPSVSPYRRASR